ncbi:uncharacterized protein BDV14DRAFT_169867 [Aspergillus stella-maris]|uniref:uncharacterized protein n=1 Tax=Aspergillus stella-maris TaxID=1810926 RepID=UPI003CCCFDCD
MAADGPDPQNLKAWQDAFQYPIPTVRRVEQELRRDIASNKEKLRALVGTRYRELVGTAETIVSMNRRMEDVDTTLGDIGRRCNPRLMGKNYSNYAQINGGPTDEDAAKRALGAQLALLHRCSVLTSKMLRKRGSPLLIAKLLVISRQLLKNLSEQKSAPPFVETLRNQLASLRLGLKTRIDKRLASAKSVIGEVIEALAAYCLATGSSSDDAVGYYHKIRLDVIGLQLDEAKTSGANILTGLRLYVQTLQVSKTILSRRFTDVLNQLKSRPLFTDPDVRSVDDLSLDVLGRWIATDIVNFTPWIKVNEQSKQDAERMIKKWSKDAFDEFVRRSQASLAKWVDFSQLLQLRKETLELWLLSWSSTPTHSALQVLEGIRNVFNGRLTDVLSDKANALDIFAQAVRSAVSSWDTVEHGSAMSMWDHELVSLDYSNGAAAFKEAIGDRLLGRDTDVITATDKYQSWLASIGALKEAIEALKEVRWPDILDEATDEDLDIDIAAILNEDDRKLLWDALEAAVKKAVDTLQNSFSDIYKAIGDSRKGESTAFMLKLIRLVRRERPHEFISSDTEFSKDIVPGLQESLAADVIAATRPLSLATLVNRRSKTLAGRTLWEGEPEVPVQPSPATFKYLRRLVESVDRHGHGLWDMSTVQVLQTVLQKELAERINSYLKDLEPPKSSNKSEQETKGETETKNNDGGERKEEPSSEKKDDESAEALTEAQLADLRLQVYFDTMLLSNASNTKESKSLPLQEAAEKIRKSLGSESDSISKTMDQRAQEYWVRTRLLFGLLAIDSA